MKILQKYVFKELLLPFFVAVIVLNFIFMAGYLVTAANFIIGRHVPLLDTLYILILAMPEMITYTIPTSIMTAIMIAFGGLAQGNELRAMKASGVHLFYVIVPAFALGLILSLVMFVFTDQVSSNARFQLRKTTKSMLIKYPKALIEPGRFVKLNDSIIFLTKEVHDDQMRDIVAYEVEKEDRPVRTIIADRGEIISGTDHSEMRIRLYDGSISDAEDEGVNTIQFQTYEFPPLDTSDIRNMRKKKKDLTMAEILIYLADPHVEKNDIIDLRASFHERIAFAFGNFIFVLIGVPIAILVKRGEVIVSFGISMVTVSLYYVMFAGAKALALQEQLPASIALWLPNLLLLFVGYILLRKAVKT
ncbi:MAG: LptF/LptG family permease [Candidatus Omnitrophica bacterium]|nr:LptF/LptG family permease [Candidatus Omnitrophota bacterium]